MRLETIASILEFSLYLTLCLVQKKSGFKGFYFSKLKTNRIVVYFYFLFLFCFAVVVFYVFYVVKIIFENNTDSLCSFIWLTRRVIDRYVIILRDQCCCCWYVLSKLLLLFVLAITDDWRIIYYCHPFYLCHYDSIKMHTFTSKFVVKFIEILLRSSPTYRKHKQVQPYDKGNYCYLLNHRSPT